MTTVSHPPKKGYRTIRLTLSESKYDLGLFCSPSTGILAEPVGRYLLPINSH